MSFLIKSLAGTLIFAILSFTVHHVTSDADVVESAAAVFNSAGLKSSQAAGLSVHNRKGSSDKTTTSSFQHLMDQLEAARSAAAAMPGYTAHLEMQEEVGGDLRPVDRIEFKTRREPFSVYMRWTDSEQEALYVDGENDNRLIVKPTKGLAAFRRVWRLAPDSRMAKQTCRYSITDAGIKNLVIRIQSFYTERNLVGVAECRKEQSTVSQNNATVFEVSFPDEATVPEYSGSRLCFDEETNLLIAVDNYGWSGDGEPRLIEHYFYDQIEVLTEPNEDVFDEENPEYQFVAR